MSQENGILLIDNILLAYSGQSFDPLCLDRFIRNHEQLGNEREQINRQDV